MFLMLKFLFLLVYIHRLLKVQILLILLSINLGYHIITFQYSEFVLYNYIYFTCQQGYAQNLSSQASAVRELLDVQAGFRKGGGTRDQIDNIGWIMEKAKEFQRSIYFSFINYVKASDCASQQTVENSSTDGNTRPPYLSS